MEPDLPPVDRVTTATLRALDRAADPQAVRHYRDELAYARRRGMTVFLTLSHFTLPSWVHDPIAARDALKGVDPERPPPAGARRGWLDAGTVTEFRKYAAYLGWKYGDLVDFWTPLNEPMVVATSGYVNVPGAFSGNFPPGAFTYRGVLDVVQNLANANAAAYDQLKAWDRRDAGGGPGRASVGLVQNMIAFTPKSSASAADVRSTEHADYIFNRLFLDAAVKGIRDVDANAVVDPGERRPGLAGKADFIGVNYYFRGRVASVGAPLSPVIPILDFLPATSYRTPLAPDAAPCPTTCSDFGSELYAEGFSDVLRTAGRYRRPIYITENGIADADDDQRPAHLVSHLQRVRRAIATREADVRGYFHWSLTDNFEWSSGYLPKFGLYTFDPRTLRRTARPSARHYGQIARANAIPSALLRRFGP
jgi:beta-glucosidase/6-phospho-beta-glucosidase/beta-galactosidase